MIGGATVQPLPIFVYGTLLEGQPSASIWHGNVNSVEAAVCHGGRLLDCGYFPIMVDEPGHHVVGQLYRVKPQQFRAFIQALDIMEGFDPAAPEASTFRRERRDVIDSSGESVTAWTYVSSDKRALQYLPAVLGGDWRRYIAKRDP